ncbi:pilus assembly protein TadG-related protein [Halalkalibacter urbisdiaboli]|uniref:pilus assembly protein TadG-related protein n=1 Tax=Halalkalibacter urbisdiaboli TaxID=1960589 RepID=UPI000B4511EE|nr:pilus assembly protein TadG-related protein [Halalkalibacter urbisdiaboli]
MKVIHSEEGNISLVVIASMGAMIVMFLIIFSMANAFLVKGKATNSAEQASITATAEMYRAIKEAIAEYDAQLTLDDVLAETLQEKIDRHKQSIVRPISDSEKERIAMNEVLSSELRVYNIQLQMILRNKMSSAVQNATDAAKRVILANGGETNGGKLIFFNSDYRIEVHASARFESFIFDSLLEESQRNMMDEGFGPALSFVEYLTWLEQERYF